MLCPFVHFTLSPGVPWGMAFFIAPGRCIQGLMHFNLGFGHHGNNGLKQLSGEIGLEL